MPKNQVVGYLSEEVARKRLKQQPVTILLDSYDEIIGHVKKETAAILKMYQTINAQYKLVSEKYNI